jgi:hypothetical protein
MSIADTGRFWEILVIPVLQILEDSGYTNIADTGRFWKILVIRLFEICFHFAGYRSSTQDISAGPSEYLPHLHSLCKIVLKPSNVIPLLLF